jgi:hypothetical protein
MLDRVLFQITRPYYQIVESITSKLAFIWRSLTLERKMVFAECATELDRSQATRQKPKPRPRAALFPEFPLPLIHIVRRSESSGVAADASVNCLRDPMGDGIERFLA